MRTKKNIGVNQLKNFSKISLEFDVVRVSKEGNKGKMSFW
jgi:hypothetical protein